VRTLKFTGFFIVLVGASLAFSFRRLLKLAGLRPPAPGALSERWLFEPRRHRDDQ
jgi:hypothetical protein